MLANYLIALREALEASLVVGILVAYVVRTDRRHLVPRIWAGVGLAVAISLAFGALLTFGATGLSEQTEPLIAGTLSLLAVCFVTAMVFWMAKAARGLSGALRDRVDLAADGGRWALALVALLAVGREGLETALFLWATTQSVTGGTGSQASPLLGALLGIATAVALGWAIYRGALKLDLGRFFKWTGVFLIIVAAGVLAYAVHEFQEVGVLPGEDDLLFNVTSVIAPDSWIAALLKGIFNFSPTMTVLAGIAWVAYVVPVMFGFLRGVHREAPQPVASAH